jgi:predicted Fe-S protein YdhL (DUF1289 family)
MRACQDVLTSRDDKKINRLVSFVGAANAFDFCGQQGRGVDECVAWSYFNEDVKRLVLDVLTQGLLKCRPSSPLKALRALRNMGATWANLPTRPRNRFAQALARLCAEDMNMGSSSSASASASASVVSNQVVLGLEEVEGKWRMFPNELRDALMKMSENRKRLSDSTE